MYTIIRYINNRSLIKNFIRTTLAYYVFTILALGDMQTASTMFKYFILLQFPIYMISKYCIQKGLKTTILYIGLYYFMTIIMVNPSFLENLENRDAIIDSTFFAPQEAMGLFIKIALVAYLILIFNQKTISKYAAERTIRSINHFWWIRPLYTVMAQHRPAHFNIFILVPIIMIVQYFYYRYDAKKLVLQADQDTKAKEMVYYSSMNNIILAGKSNHFHSVGKILFGNILGKMDRHRILTDSLSKVYRIFPYEYVKYSQEHPFQYPAKKLILYIDSKDISRCENRSYANQVLDKLDQLKKNNMEILVVSTIYYETYKTYFENELKNHQVSYKKYPSKSEINHLDIEYFIYSKQLNDIQMKIRNDIWDLNSSLPIDDKYNFLHYQLTMIHKTFNSTELFYQLLRMIEYILHYRALYKLSVLDVDSVNNFNSFSMGGWAQIQSQLHQVMPKYLEHDEVHNAYITIQRLLKKRKTPRTCTLDEIIQSIIEMRNKYLGHGSITFSVSDELLEALMVLTKEIVLIFKEDVCILTPFINISLLREDQLIRIPTCLEDGSLLSYWIHDEEASFEEYLNYSTGLVTRNGEPFTIMLNMEGGW